MTVNACEAGRLRPHRWAQVRDVRLGEGRSPCDGVGGANAEPGGDLFQVLTFQSDANLSEIIFDEVNALSPAISTSGLISAVSRSTSLDRASPLITPSSSHSMANFERNV